MYTVDPVNTAGGLAFFEKNNVDVHILYANNNILDVQILYDDKQLYLSCVYGNPIISLRHIVWEHITRFGVNRKSSWCVFGDFNDILNNSEKTSGPRRSDNSFLPFASMIDSCDMIELLGIGNRLAWGGKRRNLWIQSKLDRAFGNKEWFKQFPASNQAFLIIGRW